ncbi:SPOSA6832_04650, partial [Sporobolomyces salmonicolor]
YSTTLALLATVVYWLYRIFLSPHFSSIRSLPGPEFIHPLWGNLQEFTDKEPGRAHADWAIQYGGAVRYRGLLGENLLMLSDPTALTYLLTANPYNYAKPADLRGDLERILGKGVVFAEGDDHRRHRRLLAPAFAHGHIKAMAPCFFDLAYQIDSRAVDMSAWKYKLDLETYETNKPPGEAVIEVSDTLTRLALDAIGKVGFDYEFNALSGHTNALSQAFYTLYSPRGAYLSPPPWVMLLHKAFGAIFHTLPRNLTKLILGDRGKSIHQAARDVEKESRKIITAKKEVIAQEGSDSLKGKKDLISILLVHLRGTRHDFQHPFVDPLGAGMPSGETRPASRGNQEGADQGAQRRQEGTRQRGAEQFGVSRRLHDPSCTLSHVRVKKGQVIYLGIYAANRNKTVFGDDADSFRPERWIDPACKIESKMGVWAGLMTFLAGPRSCIGYKFA